MVIKTGMLVRVKTAKWIQKVFSIGILLSLIVGCSSGPSAEQKRNNYDACLIEEKSRLWAKFNAENPNPYSQAVEIYKRQVEDALPRLCVDNLK